MSQQEEKIDESLYSRQLYVLGHEAMTRMAQSHVLIIGLGGLGIEIAKNVILAGVKSVTLLDDTLTTLQDLSTQFYLTEQDIGYSRAERSAEKLQQLNQYVPVHVIKAEVTEDIIKNYQAVVVTETSLKNQLQINQWTRKYDAKFISADIKGLFGMVFNDFGENFVCIDPTGNQAKSGMIAAVTKEAEGTVTCLEDVRHGLEDGDYVKFTEVQGMEELNDGNPIKIKYVGPYSFSIGDTSNFSEYKAGGIFTEVKQPKTISFKPLDQAIKNPEFLISDFAKFDRPAQLHLGFQALHQFVELNGQLPRPRNEEDAIKILELTNKLNEQNDKIELNEDLIKELSYQARGSFAPIASVIGGIVAQEVLKSVSGKFHPIQQYLYFDSLESLPVNFKPSESSVQPLNTRYDAQIAIFGSEFQNILNNSKQFLVGSGAIGCEMLKNWALIGLGSGPNGKIHITDMDTIEKSNLNRQFLFRPKDVGQLKSTTASKAVISMNPELNGKIIAHSSRVGPETENFYNDEFFESLDFVTNALDNVEARTYMDRRCVYYLKPLLESGTLGTLGNTQVVVPHLTESYSSTQDPPEKSIPVCTLKNFPNKVEHTIQWARDLFEGKFKQAFENVIAYSNQREKFIEEITKQNSNPLEILSSVKEILVDQKPNNFDDCISYARFLFEELFNNTIQQLLFNFPVDTVTAEGNLFWSGPKRAPTPIAFNANDELHLNFIVATANIRAFNYGIQGNNDVQYIKHVSSYLNVPEFVPKSGVKIQVNENEPVNENITSRNDPEVDEIIKSLPKGDEIQSSIVSIEFEKDDDTNYHIDFITAASNLRARNYEIAEADRHTTKGIAGKIIPAIATTTSLVTGLVCLEMVKIVDHVSKKESLRKIEDFKNAFVNLALPLLSFSEPGVVPKFKWLENTSSLWDRFDIKENLTLRQLIEYFKQNHKIVIEMISSNSALLYNAYFSAKKAQNRLDMSILEAIESASKKKLNPHNKYVVLDAVAVGVDDEDIEEIPYIRVKVRD